MTLYTIRTTNQTRNEALLKEVIQRGYFNLPQKEAKTLKTFAKVVHQIPLRLVNQGVYTSVHLF